MIPRPKMNTRGMSRDQKLLIKRTAWLQIEKSEQPPQMSPEEIQKLTDTAIRMLNFTGCLNYAIDDLKTELQQSGLFKGIVPRCYSFARRAIINAHGKGYRMLSKININAGYQYNDSVDSTWAKIDRCVLLSSPERAFNIIMALCRIIQRLNMELGLKYYFTPAEVVGTIPSKLDCVKIQDYRIDNIIELNTR